MALFKILKGKSINLPANKVDGYCYVTTDDSKFYVDYTKDDGTLDRFALNAVSADKWVTARNLNGMMVDGASNVVNYGICSTAAATAAKVVSCSNFALIIGAEITVKFTTTNTASSPTLNVNSTGAKAIYYRGSAISAGYLAANRTYTFRYNGTQYELVGDINTDTNTDTKVTQTVTTSDASYPLLLAPNGQTATTTTTSYFDSEVTLNPSTNTIAANISGNAATADTAQKAVKDNAGNTIDTFYLPLSAGQDKKLIGPLGLTENVNYGSSLPDNGFVGQLFFLEEEEKPSLPTGGTAGQALVKNSSTDGDASWKKLDTLPKGGIEGDILIKASTTDGDAVWQSTYQHTHTWNDITDRSTLSINTSGTITATKVYGAVWNDYAEFRNQKEIIEPGYCVASSDNGQVYKTTEKFQACDGIVSDTFGFAIGQTEKCQTPLAVSGRVLAYYEGNINNYHSGDTVCAGPNGKICKMTREEIKEYPDRIVGIVSEIPTYEKWNNIYVKNRIWIKIR